MSVFVIAEIGINHNGDLALAKRLIDLAVKAGCNAVKFQKRAIDVVYSKEYLDGFRESPWGTSQREQKEGLEFGVEEYDQIHAYCKEKSIEWFASAWDLESQGFLEKYDLKYNKIASAMLTRTALLEAVAKEGKYTFISTGMSSWKEVDDAVKVFKAYNCPFELMHCNSTYPMKEEDANLSLIGKLRVKYGVDVGYSGHETGKLVSICAVAAGATSIERHITLDRTMYGSDQSASMEPNELEEMVQEIRRIEIIMGSGDKVLSEAEENVKKKLRG